MAKEHTPSELVAKGYPCPDTEGCRSSDAAALYTDDRLHCYSCGKDFRNVGMMEAHPDDPSGATRRAHMLPQHTKELSSMELQQAAEQGRVSGIKSRAITSATAAFWGYRLHENHRGELEHLAVYRDPKGAIVGVKSRNTGEEGDQKDITWSAGSAKGNLWGRHLWPAGGQWLVITEGEIDAMSVSQMYSHKRPVVSLPNGAGATDVEKVIAKNLEWINSFDKVIIATDMDEPGRLAAETIARLLPPGKAHMAILSGGKDANELLVAGKGEALTLAIHNAEAWRPDGLVDARNLTEECLTPPTQGMPWPWKSVTKLTYGRRFGEVYTVGAGFGIGKTDELAEVIAADITGQTKYGVRYEPQATCMFAYEAGAAKMKKAVAGKLVGRRFHIAIEDIIEEGLTPWTQEELAEVMARMDGPIWNAGGRLYINDSKGAADWQSVVDRCRFIRWSEGVRHFWVDPLSAVVEEELEDSDDERKIIDRIMRQASKLAVELDSCFYIYSHLTRPSLGPSHEEGGQVRGNQFRGSNAIGMFSNYVIGLERNTQAEDERERTLTTVRIVKDRHTGNNTGKIARLHYDILGGTLDEPAGRLMGDDE